MPWLLRHERQACIDRPSRLRERRAPAELRRGRCGARRERCRASFPHLRIRLDTTIMDWDFDPNRADMGLIYAVNPGRDGVEYRPLLRAQLVLVCDKSIGEAIKSRSDLARLAKIEVA